MELDFSNCQSSLLSSLLSLHFRHLIMLSLLVQILGFCSGRWLGYQPAEDGLAIMQGGHGSWSLVHLTYTGPRFVLCKLLGLVHRWVFLVGCKREIRPSLCVDLFLLLLLAKLMSSFLALFWFGLLMLPVGLFALSFPEFPINHWGVVD